MGEKKEKLKVEDLKQIIQSQNNNKGKRLDDFNNPYEELKELRIENKKLQAIVDMYRTKRAKFYKTRNSILAYVVLLSSILCGIKIKNNYDENKLTKKETSIEKQLNKKIRNFNLVEILGGKVKNPQDIKLGTVLEDYIGMDLDDKKVSLLNDLSEVASIKYQLDSENLNGANDFLSKYCVYFLSEYISNTIYIDNPELENYNINIQDGYLYANGKYQMNSELFNSYSLGEDAYEYILYRDEFEITVDDLDSAIDTCLKATCYDVLLNQEEEKLDFSVSRLAKECDYQLPLTRKYQKDYCELPKQKVKN